jgi:hypothetical protein
MMNCWREGRKLIDTTPHEGEIYFVIGNACMELIKKLNETIEEEVNSWQQ